MTAGPDRGGVLRLGDRVRFDGVEHGLVGLSGTSVRLAGDDGAAQVVLVTCLQSTPDFAVLSGSQPVSMPPLGLLDAVPPAALEQARWWERHVVEVETELPPDAEPATLPRPGYDPAVRTLAQRAQAKAEELTVLGHAVSVRTIRRRRAAYAASGLWGLVEQRGAGELSDRTGRRAGGGRGAAGAGRAGRHVDRHPGTGATTGGATAGRGAWAGCGGAPAGVDVLPAVVSAGHRWAPVRGGDAPLAGESARRAVRPGARAAAGAVGAGRHDAVGRDGGARRRRDRAGGADHAAGSRSSTSPFRRRPRRECSRWSSPVSSECRSRPART